MRVPIRFIAASLGIFLCPGFASLSCFAQEVQVPRVSVGAVTKYTGPASSAQEQQSQEFLSNLELQLASGFAKSGDIDYLDRSNLYELFRELHISSWSFFDASTGSLHGLMGRLDFLIVAEASSATTARVKILDVETGAVKIATLCQPRTTMFGKASTDAPECVSQIVSQMATFAKMRFTTKRDRLIKAAVSQQEAEERTLGLLLVVFGVPRANARKRDLANLVGQRDSDRQPALAAHASMRCDLHGVRGRCRVTRQGVGVAHC